MTYIASKCKKIDLGCERLTHLDIAVGHLCCVRGGHSDFRFCGQVKRKAVYDVTTCIMPYKTFIERITSLVYSS